MIKFYYYIHIYKCVKCMIFLMNLKFFIRNQLIKQSLHEIIESYIISDLKSCNHNVSLIVWLNLRVMEKNKKNYIVSQNKTNWWHENILNISQSIKKEVSNLYVYLSTNHNYMTMTEIVLREKSIERESSSTRTTDHDAEECGEIVTDKFAVICLKKDKVHRANLTEVRVKVYRGREETTFSRSVHVSFLPRSTPTRVEQHAISLP